jgi:hypothetical protein
MKLIAITGSKPLISQGGERSKDPRDDPRHAVDPRREQVRQSRTELRLDGRQAP